MDLVGRLIQPMLEGAVLVLYVARSQLCLGRRGKKCF